MQIKIRLHVVFLLWEEIEIRAEICEKKKKQLTLTADCSWDRELLITGAHGPQIWTPDLIKSRFFTHSAELVFLWLPDQAAVWRNGMNDIRRL